MERIRRCCEGRRLTVVLSSRRLSSLIPSSYQQQARIQRMPSFEDWARGVITDTMRERDDGWSRALQANAIADGWRAYSDNVVVVDVDVPDLQRGLRALWRVLIGEYPAPAFDAPRNARLPPEMVAAMQRYLQKRRGLSVAEKRRVLHRANAKCSNSQRSVAARLSLSPELTRLVDRLPSGDSEAKQSLEALLASGAPLTHLDLAAGVTAQDWDDSVASHYRRILYADRLLILQRLANRGREGHRRHSDT